MQKIIKKISAYCAKNWFFLLLLILTIIMRFYQLGKVPSSLYIDELAMLVDAKSLTNTGRDIYGKSFFQATFLSYGDYKLPVYIWLASASVKVFGVNEFALRLPSALAGLASLLITYLLAKKLFAKKENDKQLLKILVLVVLAFAPWSFLFSRTGFEGHVGQMLLALAVLLLFYALKKHWLIIIASAVASLAVYAYFSVRFVWPVIYLMFGLIFFFKKNSASKNQRFLLKKLMMFLLGGLIFILLLQPLYKNEYYLASNQFRLSAKSVLNIKDWAVESNILREQTGNNLLSRLFYHRHFLLIQSLAKNYAQNLSLNFLFFEGDSNLRHGTGQHGLFLWPLTLPFIIGFLSLLRKNFSVFAFLFVWIIIAFLPASVPMEVPHALRSLNALVPLALMIVFGLKELILFGQQNKINNLALNFFYLILFISNLVFLEFYFKQYPTTSALFWQDKHKEFILELLKREKEVDYIYVQPFSSEAWLGFLAYGQNLTDFSSLQFMGDDLYQISSKIELKELNKDQWANIFEKHHSFIVAGRYAWYLNDWPKNTNNLKEASWINNSLGEKEFIIMYYEN